MKVVKDEEERVRSPFTDEELSEIVSNLDQSSDLYWPFLCALYSGMRGGEIVSLKVCDIKQHSSIWYFDIYGPRVKKWSTREVPIHEKLIKLGFLKYVSAQSEHLFPAFAYGKRGSPKTNTDYWQGHLSTNFSNYLARLGIKHDLITLHSARHNFTDACRVTDIAWSIALWVQGRRESGSSRVYGVGAKMKEKKKVVDAAKYDLKL